MGFNFGQDLRDAASFRKRSNVVSVEKVHRMSERHIKRTQAMVDLTGAS